MIRFIYAKISLSIYFNRFAGGKSMATNCETCANYYYDEETEEYCCDVSLDEDEMVRFLSAPDYNCPFYRVYDEYGTVRKQN